MAHRLCIPARADKKSIDPVTATTRHAFPEVQSWCTSGGAVIRGQRPAGSSAVRSALAIRRRRRAAAKTHERSAM
jgi:hypothetical protein